MQVATGVDVRKIQPDLLKRLECVDKFFVLMKEKMRLVPPYAGPPDVLDLYCEGLAVDINNPVEMTDKFHDDIHSCFNWDYDLLFELDRIIVTYNQM